MKIEYRKSAAATPAFALIAEGWNELVQDGMTTDLRADCPVDVCNEVLHYERDDGEIVGVVCWFNNEVTNAFVVSLAYVEPTSRRHGVFRELYAKLRDRALTASISRIVFQVHPQNAGMVEVVKKLGAMVVSLTFDTILFA